MYNIFINFGKRGEIYEKDIRNTVLLMILPWIFVWGILCILEKRKRKNEDGNKR